MPGCPLLSPASSCPPSGARPLGVVVSCMRRDLGRAGGCAAGRCPSVSLRVRHAGGTGSVASPRGRPLWQRGEGRRSRCLRVRCRCILCAKRASACPAVTLGVRAEAASCPLRFCLFW